MDSDPGLREIESEVAAAIRRLGASGVVRVEGSVVTLSSERAEAAVEASALIGGWHVLSTPLRQRKVDDLAQRLIDGMTARSGAAPVRTPVPSDRTTPAPPEPLHPAPPLDAAAHAGRAEPAARLALEGEGVVATSREIQVAVRRTLASHGFAGVATVRGPEIELYAGGARSSLELGALPVQWSLLPDEIRERKIQQLARALVAAHRGAHGEAIALRTRGPRVIVVPLGALVLLALIAVFGMKLYAGWGKTEPPPPVQVGETEEQGQARRTRACEAARKRIFSGAAIGPFEMEGWFTELWLATRADVDPQQDAAVLRLVEGGKIGSADPELASLADGKVEIVPGFEPERGARSPGWRAVTVRFSGAYVGAFVDPALRPRFIALADRLASAVPAEVGALYGRCAHLPYHDLGAWFRGTDASAAAAALIYGAGMLTETPAVDRGALAKLDAAGGGELSAMRAAAVKIDATALGALVGAQGGGITKMPSGAVTVTFPVGGGTRALAASRAVARKIGIGVAD